MSSILDNAALFAHRVLIATGVIALVGLLIYFLSQLIDVLLLAFAGVLVAVAVDGLTRGFQRYLPGRRIWSLLAALLLLLLLLAGAGALIVPQAAEQLPMLFEQLPQAVTQLGEMLQQLPGSEAVMEEAEKQAEEAEGLLGPELLAQLGGVFSTAVGAVAGFFIILLFALYVVLSPSTYAHHFLRLIPIDRRQRVGEVMATQAKALRLWLLSRLISMVFVGVATGVGLMLLDVPLAFTLGLLSGLLTFIPYLGPILAAIPTALVALLESPELALYAVLLYFAVETVEANVVFPLAARGVVHLPPAYTVIIQLAGGAVAGFQGVVLATPLAVAAAVAIQMLYIEDTLGDEVEVLGGSGSG